MSFSWKPALALCGVLACATAAGTSLDGHLELQWGDPARDSALPAQFNVSLVDAAGQRHRLDPDAALRAAEDLYALAGRRVALELDATVQAGADGLLQPSVIVAADRLAAAAGSANVAPAVVGTTTWVTLMCKFADIETEQKDRAFFNSQYGTAPGQLGHYWNAVSYGRINLAGSAAYGWVTLPQPRSFYVPAGGSANLNRLFDDCTAAADSQVDFSANGGVQGINMMFNGDLDGFAWGGGRCATLDGVHRCWRTTWNPPWSFNNLAVLAHEMGHGYGLPHANNSDRDSDPYDNPWDVMSDAWNNALSSPVYGSLPKHINTYHRDRMGWVAPARMLRIDSATFRRGLQLDFASSQGSQALQMIVVTAPGSNGQVHYTIEARQRAGTYEGALAGTAVILHEVRQRNEPSWSIDADVPPANRSNNEGSMFKVGEQWLSPDGGVRIRVDSLNTNGFTVTVQRLGDNLVPSPGTSRIQPPVNPPPPPPSPRPPSRRDRL